MGVSIHNKYSQQISLPPVKDLNTYNSHHLEPSIITTFKFRMRIVRYVVHLSKVCFCLNAPCVLEKLRNWLRSVLTLQHSGNCFSLEGMPDFNWFTCHVFSLLQCHEEFWLFSFLVVWFLARRCNYTWIRCIMYLKLLDQRVLRHWLNIWDPFSISIFMWERSPVLITEVLHK